MRRAVLLAAIAFAVAGPADGAYDPQLDIRVDPPTAGTAAALTATVTQAPGESATQSERVRFPAQFAFNPGLRVTRCTAAAEHAARCPDDSRIGTASAQTMLGDFTGPVHLTADFRFVAFLRGFAGLVQQEISGYLLLEPDGSVESVLDGLPNVPATLARVAFDSGPRSLFLTPRTCRSYVIDAHFTSHAGDRVSRKVPVQIGGCDSTPRIERADVAPQRLLGTRRRVTVSWRLTDAGSATIIEVQRMARAGRFVRWRREFLIRSGAAAGANQLTLELRRAARYQVVLSTLSTHGRPVDVARVAARVT